MLFISSLSNVLSDNTLVNELFADANLVMDSLNKLKLNNELTLFGLNDGCIESFIILKFKFNEKAYDVPSFVPSFTNFLYVGIFISFNVGLVLFCGWSNTVIPYKLVAWLPSESVTV